MVCKEGCAWSSEDSRAVCASSVSEEEGSEVGRGER